MDDDQRKSVAENIEDFNNRLVWILRDFSGVTVSKIRTSVWVDGSHIEVELRMDDPDQFEKRYQEYVKREVMRQAQEAHKHVPE